MVVRVGHTGGWHLGKDDARTIVGAAVGLWVGLAVGLSVGDAVGEAVGLAVGFCIIGVDGCGF